MRNRCVLLAVLALAGCGNRPKEIRIAIGGQNQLVYLPTTLAKQLGYYAEEGVPVQLQEFPGGAKALEAMFGGSADVVNGFYDHTVQMAAEGKALKAFVTMLRYPGNVAVASPASARNIGRMEDWTGATIG